MRHFAPFPGHKVNCAGARLWKSRKVRRADTNHSLQGDSSSSAAWEEAAIMQGSYRTARIGETRNLLLGRIVGFTCAGIMLR
jgi:hypothetical protein